MYFIGKLFHLYVGSPWPRFLWKPGACTPVELGDVTVLIPQELTCDTPCKARKTSHSGSWYGSSRERECSTSLRRSQGRVSSPRLRAEALELGQRLGHSNVCSTPACPLAHAAAVGALLPAGRGLNVEFYPPESIIGAQIRNFK